MKRLTFVKLCLPWQYDPFSDPPIGMLSVAAEAKKISGLEVSLFDMAHEKEIPNSDYYALSASTLEYPEAMKISEEIKKKNPESKIIVGGPHFDALSENYWKNEIQNIPIDIIGRGEGEKTIYAILDKLNSSVGSGKINEVFTSDGLMNLDSVPIPARELLNKEKYFKKGTTFNGDLHSKGNSSTIMVSRGCPYKCGFCASPQLHHQRVRYRNLEKIEGELNELQDVYGVTELRWQDDCIPLILRKNPGLAEILHERNIFSRGSLRVNQVNEKNLEDLWYSGFRELGCGIESAENHVLDLLHKGTSVEMNKKGLLALKEKGFKTRAYMMSGLPGETKDAAKRMIDFLEETNPDVVTLTSFIPLPGCDVYNNPSKYGVEILSRDWSKYNIALSRDEITPWTHKISSATMDEMEMNREKLKEYLFNRNKSNVSIYNKPYKAKVSN